MGAAADVQAMPKQKKKQTGPPKKRGGHTDRKKRRSNEKPRERHDAPAPAKKQPAVDVSDTPPVKAGSLAADADKPAGKQQFDKLLFELD